MADHPHRPARLGDGHVGRLLGPAGRIAGDDRHPARASGAEQAADLDADLGDLLGAGRRTGTTAGSGAAMPTPPIVTVTARRPAVAVSPTIVTATICRGRRAGPRRAWSR